MITGIVNGRLEATLQLQIRGGGPGVQAIEAVIDTGFSGDLTLPQAIVVALNLTWLGRDQGILADGSIDLFDVYAASVIWDGQPRGVEVQCMDSEPLVGMNLLSWHSLHINVVPGGAVNITRLP